MLSQTPRSPSETSLRQKEHILISENKVDGIDLHCSPSSQEAKNNNVNCSPSLPVATI